MLHLDLFSTTPKIKFLCGLTSSHQIQAERPVVRRRLVNNAISKIDMDAEAGPITDYVAFIVYEASLSVRLPAWLPAWLSVCPSVFVSIHLTIQRYVLSICLSIYRSVYLSIYLFV